MIDGTGGDPIFYALALFVGSGGLYRSVDAIRNGFVFGRRLDGLVLPVAFRARDPVRFWLLVVMLFAVGAGAMVYGAVGLDLWAWR
jgi:hypothetical protein